MSDLIDTTEMYLRTIYELVEEGIVPLRARIAERLHQSGPTVSQTVARMERDGLLTVEGDRHLELTEEGHRLATRVMRKHRAEQMPTENERPLVVTVDKAGKIFVGMQDQPVEAATLGATLQAIAKDRMDKRVYVRADEGVNYGRVMEVLSLLQGARFSQVGLPVDPQAKNRLQEGR